MNDHIVVEKQGAVLTIRMNRPDKKNAITADMYQAMADGLRQGYGDNDIRVITMLGVPGSFSSGNDIADFMQIAMSGERSSMAVFEFLTEIITAPKPVLAGVDGLAIGVGCTMLLHCDYVIASDRSLFKTPFVDLGLVPEAGSSLIAPQLMSHHKAFAFLALGEALSADDARAAGFVNVITSDAELETATMAKAAEIAAKPPEALKISRDLIRGDRADILQRMKDEAVLFGERLQSDEARQAFSAFMSKGQKKAS